jgi:hypothetical protein
MTKVKVAELKSLINKVKEIDEKAELEKFDIQDKITALFDGEEPLPKTRTIKDAPF